MVTHISNEEEGGGCQPVDPICRTLLNMPALWEAFRNQLMDGPFESLLKKIYDGQTALSLTDAESEEFKKRRGTTQGDPQSSLLFKCGASTRNRKNRNVEGEETSGQAWEKAKTYCISNLRFADDVVLRATSLHQLKKLTTDFSRSTTKHGMTWTKTQNTDKPMVPTSRKRLRSKGCRQKSSRL